MNTSRGFLALALMLSIAPMLLAKNKQPLEHAPFPAKVLSAKTIFIQNETNQPGIADKAYTQLKSWGKYQIVDSKEKADLVLLFTLGYSHTQHQDSDYVSLYNSQTGAYTSGVVPGGTTTVTWTYTQVRVIDPATSDVMWADERPWLRKRSATDELMEVLRQRVEEQEKESSR